MALGRKNFLFVGHEEAGHNLAALYTVVALCVLAVLETPRVGIMLSGTEAYVTRRRWLANGTG